MNDLLYKDESFSIIGACFAVYNDKGCGFLEPVYQECLEIELDAQKVLFTPHPELKLFYRGKELKQRYIPDIICYGKIIVELKAVTALCDEHRAQMLNYLHATGFKLGFLVNFGHFPGLQYERIIL